MVRRPRVSTRALLACLVVLTVGWFAPGAGAKEDQASLSFVHGLPDVVADLSIDGDVVTSPTELGQVTDPITVAPGTHDVQVLDGDGGVLLESEVELAAGDDITLVAHLTPDGGTQLSRFTNDVTPIPAGQARVVLRHTAAAPAVDGFGNGQPVVLDMAVEDQEELLLPPDTYELSLAPTGTGEVIASPGSLTVRAGSAYFVHVVGTIEPLALDLVVQERTGLAAAPGAVDAGNGGLAGDPSGPDVPVAAIALLLVVAAGAATVLWRGRARTG
jgi:Domain of unknown function (DUF4397)